MNGRGDRNAEYTSTSGPHLKGMFRTERVVGVIKVVKQSITIENSHHRRSNHNPPTWLFLRSPCSLGTARANLIVARPHPILPVV